MSETNALDIALDKALDDKIVAAIRAHMNWRVRLQDAISRQDALDMEAIANDRRCELGRWMVELQPTLGQTWEWLHLDQVHMRFHREAATCAQLIAEQKTADATFSIREGGYALASHQILDALLRLRDALLRAENREEPEATA